MQEERLKERKRWVFFFLFPGPGCDSATLRSGHRAEEADAKRSDSRSRLLVFVVFSSRTALALPPTALIYKVASKVYSG